MRTRVETLAPEDLERFRKARLDKWAVECAPSDLSFEEMREIIRTAFETEAEIVEEYQIDEAETWEISLINGAIYYDQ